MTKTAGMSARDLKLLIGFAFFLEIVLAYMLLLDGPLTEAARLEGQVAKAREARSTLQVAVAAREAEKRSALQQNLPASLAFREGENPSVAIQRFLNGMIVACNASLLVLNVRPLPGEVSAAPGYQATATVEGSYESIAKLVGKVQRPEVLMGVDSIRVRTGTDDPERLQADLALTFYFLTPAEPAPAASPAMQTLPRP